MRTRAIVLSPRLPVLTAFLVFGWVSTTQCFAQDEHHGEEEASHEQHDAGHGEHHYHKNLLAGFVGFTGEERRERAFTLGIDYERRISELFGIGVGVERVMGDLDFTVVTIPLNFHFGHWKLFTGPGVEFAHGEKEHELIRLGAEYAFDMGGYELAPKFMVDFVDGDTVVIAGVAFAWGF